jgi:putative ATP-binding cassette transporter
MRAIFRLLWQTERTRFLLAVFSGALSGAANAALLASIYKGLDRAHPAGHVLHLWFIALVLAVPAFSVISQRLIITFAQRVGVGLAMRLVSQILAAPLRNIEQIGAPKLLSVLTNDVSAVCNALVRVRDVCLNGVILLGCLAFLGWVTAPVLLAALAFGSVGWIGYWIAQGRADLYLRAARKTGDDLFQHYRTLTMGAKELKLHHSRRHSFLVDILTPTHGAFQTNNLRGLTIYAVATNWFYLLWFTLLGLIVFLLPTTGVSTAAVAGSALLLLYIVNPLSAVTGALPDFARARVAMERVEEMGMNLLTETSSDESQGCVRPLERWDQLELHQVIHRYDRRDGRGFQMGPITLTLNRGEMVFVTGGNGSGKTTLGKVLSGLYMPDEGEILLDRKPVGADNIESYRQQFSAIFSDFHLFDRLLGLEYCTEPDVRALLEDLKLNRVVDVNNGVFSSVELSRGQQKRLALLTAMLEDRSIYIFDEWAADQDQDFRELFYHQLLDKLQARGKTVVVITHDERYFHLAKRIIGLNEGQIVYDRAASTTEFVDRQA